MTRHSETDCLVRGQWTTRTGSRTGRPARSILTPARGVPVEDALAVQPRGDPLVQVAAIIGSPPQHGAGVVRGLEEPGDQQRFPPADHGGALWRHARSNVLIVNPDAPETLTVRSADAELLRG